MRADPNRSGDTRSLAVVTDVRMLAPQEVVGLVRGQFNGADDEKSDAGEDDKSQKKPERSVHFKRVFRM